MKIHLIIPPSPFLLDEKVFMSLGILKIAAVLESSYDVNIIDFGLAQHLNIIAVQTISDISKHNVNSRYIDSAIRLGHYSSLINKDYYVFLGNSINSILQKIKLYKENFFVEKIKFENV